MNQNLLRTIVLLIVTVVLVPLAAFRQDSAPLNAQQWEVLSLLCEIMIGTALFCFALGELTRNCSQVDKLWSIMPIIYSAVVCYYADFQPRVLLMTVLVAIWGIRLSYNFSRRGGYSWRFWSGEEDYRWNVLRRMPLLAGRLRWALFNLFFICLYQMSLILLFTLPVLIAWQGENQDLGIVDYLLAAAMLSLIAIETIADQQQYNFQTEKHRRINAGEALGEPYSDGFVSSGLWRLVRHPNYAAEQSIWWVFYGFSVAATGSFLNWTIGGALLLLLLFQGSADFSENISTEKYPKYKDYIKNTPRFLPRLF